MAPPAFAVAASLRICRRSYAGLRCRPLQAKGKADGRIERVHASAKRAREPMLSHKTLVTLQGSRVEQSPTPTMDRERVGKIISAISVFHSRGRACSARVCRAC